MKPSETRFSARPNLKPCLALAFLATQTTQLNFGLTESYSSALQISNPQATPPISIATQILITLALAYTLSALNILKHRYTFLTALSHDSLFHPSHPLLTTLLTTLYLNLDSFLFLLFSTISLQPQVALQTLINQDVVNFTLILPFALIFGSKKRPKNIKFNMWKTVKNLTMILVFYFQILLGKLLGQNWIAGIWLLPCWLVSVLVDWKSEVIMGKVYGMMGVVAEDESFDIEGLVKQRRRRYSITYLRGEGEGEGGLGAGEVKMHVERWKGSLKKRYELEPIFVKSHTDKLVRLIEAVWKIIYSIRGVGHRKSMQRNRQGDLKMRVKTEYLDSDGSLKDDFVGAEGDQISIGVSEEVRGEDEEGGLGQKRRSSGEMKGSSPKKHLAGQEKAAKAVAGLNKGFGMEQSKVFASKDDPAQISPGRRLKGLAIEVVGIKRVQDKPNFQRQFGNETNIADNPPKGLASGQEVFEVQNSPTYNYDRKNTVGDMETVGGYWVVKYAGDRNRGRRHSIKKPCHNLLRYPEKRIHKFFYVVFFPIITFLYFMIPMYRSRKISDKDNLYQILGVTTFIMIVFVFLIFYMEMIQISQWGMKMHIFGVLNSLIFNIAHLGYTMEELSKENKEKENDNTITSIVTSILDASKFKFGFAAGTMWVMGVAIDANLDFDNGTIFYFTISFLLVFFLGALVVGGVVKFDFNRRLAWVLPCVYCIYIIVNLLF